MPMTASLMSDITISEKYGATTSIETAILGKRNIFINDKKIVVAKIGKDFSWFSFVTLFITLYGLILYVFGMIKIYNAFNDTVTFYGILILTVVTFAIGYWWFVNNTGEKRLREVYDN